MCVGCSLSVAIPINIHPCRANLQARVHASLLIIAHIPRPQGWLN
jgi:hypothetical protein